MGALSMRNAAWLGRWFVRGRRPLVGHVRPSPSALPPRLEVLEARLLPSLTPHLLKDINPGPMGSVAPSPRLPLFVDVNHTAYFAANDGAHGSELWKSNGAAAGTLLVKDINPGASSSPTYLTNVNGTLFFTAIDPVHGDELWRSNGTPAGTVLVKDIHPGTTG